ncbi:cation:proton antiporter [Streptomyces sp. NPDC050617]|uniref:cation:proton antiporter domain-containing protein n=1 Tax=Streptomyces sp. NPDC050617 TaxID=3154628 RepID=UPI00343E60AE
MDRLNGLLGDPDPTPRILVSLFIPALVCVASEHVHGSGVLAVLVYTLYMVNHPAPAEGAAARVSSDSFWEITETLITGVAFGLIGLELRTVADTVTDGRQGLLGPAALFVVTVVAVRVLWLLPAVWVSGRLERAQRKVRWKLEQPHVPIEPDRRAMFEVWDRRIQERIDARTDTPLGRRETLVMWWSRMRGVATVALALAVPPATDTGRAFPGRPQLVFVAFCVVMLSTLSPGVVEEMDDEFRSRADWVRQFRDCQERLATAARAELIAARRESGVIPELVDRLIHRLDLQSLLVETPVRGSHSRATDGS